MVCWVGVDGYGAVGADCGAGSVCFDYCGWVGGGGLCLVYGWWLAVAAAGAQVVGCLGVEFYGCGYVGVLGHVVLVFKWFPGWKRLWAAVLWVVVLGFLWHA